MSSIVFVDSRVENRTALIAAFPVDSTFVELQSNQDGLQQIASALTGYKNLSAIHIVSHGSVGAVYVGATVINNQNIASYEQLLAGIGNSLNENGDILFYGCDIAGGEEGNHFVNQLAHFTGADVAASTNITGVGGDWQLEKKTGVIENEFIMPSTYQSSLAVTDGFIVDVYGTEGVDWQINGSEHNNRMYGYGGGDYMYGNEGSDTIDGGAGNDYLNGGDDNDLLLGAAGDDELRGNAGDDTLNGGVGNDKLEGDTGTDVYQFSLGGGQDKINAEDYGGSDVDRIVFDNTISVNAVRLSRKVATDDLVISFSGNTTDTLTVLNYFNQSAETQGYSRITLNFANGTVWNSEDISQKVISMDGTTASDWMYGTAGANVMRGNSGNDYIYGYDGNDTLEGGDGGDQIEAGDGADVLRGDASNDRLYGNSGDDILNGGTGNDLLEGNAGSDTYVFEVGSGQDQVNAYDYNSTDVDVVQFGAGFTTSDVRFARGLSTDDLVVSFLDKTDTLTVKNYFGYSPDIEGYNRIKFSFTDGTLWSIDDILVKVVSVEGSSSGNYLYGTANPNAIRGNAGNDYLYGYANSDTLEGGDGNDEIQSGTDNDLAKGDAGNDRLYGNDGDDTLDGGTGNDVLEGNAGADTYIFNLGSGQDQINNYDYNSSDVDTVLFGADITANTLRFARSLSGDDLVISLSGSTDTLAIDNYFGHSPDVNGYSRIKLKFTNGVTLDAEDLLKKVVSMEGSSSGDYLYGTANPNSMRGNSGNDYLYGYAQNDTLEGGDGNDQIEGGDDNDVLQGDAGNDRLYGNTGDDTLNGGAGNDFLEGGQGVDTYRFGIGSGLDQINNYDYNSGDIDRILLGSGITSDKVSFARALGTDDLVLRLTGNTDTLTVKDYFNSGAESYGFNRITMNFNDGTVWNVETLSTRVINMLGSSSNDWLYGASNPDLMQGGSGNDYLYGYGGSDTLDGGDGSDNIEGNDGADLLIGGAGNDRLYGKDGNDTLNGGAGNDQLEGQAGADVYTFDIGSGQDEINAYDYNNSDIDIVSMGAGITTSSLMMSRVVNTDDLLIRLTNSTTDSLKIKSYFSYDSGTHGYSRIELKFTDGSSWSNGVFTIANPNNAPTGNLTISGNAAQGQTLTAVSNLADADGLGTLNYQWLANGALIEGATSATFTLGLAQVGKVISVRANYTDGLNNAESVVSAGTTTVAGVNNAPTGRLTISGVINPEQTLTAVSTIADADGLGTLNYQWFADGNAINGATARTFVLTSAQLGKSISVQASYTDNLGNAEVVQSAATGAVTIAQEAGIVFGNINGLSTSEAGSSAEFQVSLRAEPRHNVTLTFTINDATEGKFQSSGNATATITFTANNWNTPQTITLLGVDDSLSDGNMAYVISTRVSSEDLRYDGMRSGSGLSVPTITIANTDDDAPDEWYGDAGGTAIADLHTGGNGDSDLYGLNSRDELHGGNGNDRLYGGNGDDVLYGDADNDELEGDQGNDKLYGNIGNDTLTGGTGKDSLYGGDGNDVLDGSSDRDFMDGGNGADTYYVDNIGDVVRDTGTDNAKDVLYVTAYLQGGYVLGAGIDNAVLAALANNASLTGNAGKNVLTGNASANALKGGAGVDTLNGGAGDDTLIGGAGKDVLSGGAGNDIFKLEKLIESGLTATVRDTVQGFVRGQDKLGLSSLDANSTVTGNQAFSAFINSTAEFTKAGQLQFKNGILYGNTDNDAAAEFSIALTGISTLTMSDVIA